MSRLGQDFCERLFENRKSNIDRDCQRSVHCLFNCLKHQMTSTACKYDATTPNIIIEKERVVGKEPRTNSNVSQKILRFKRDNTMLQRTVVDMAVNTQISGPLRTDNYCVTMIRKRAKEKCDCKNTPKRLRTKIVQTFTRTTTASEKSCCNRVEVMDCGTQYLEIPNCLVEPQEEIENEHNGQLENIRAETLIQTNLTNIDMEERDYASHNTNLFNHASMRKARLRELNLWQAELGSRICKDATKNVGRVTNTGYMGARRWSLSQYRSRGPDF